MAVKCFYHKRRDAVGACVNCGRLICADCEVTLKKKIYCNPCVEELFGEKAAAAGAPPAPAAVEVAPAKEVAQPPPRAPKKAVAAAKAEVAAATTADNTSGQGKGAVIPPEVRGWNWGAFLMNWMWGIGNKVGIALLTFILGPIMAIILGVKGNEWAWRNKKWKSVEHFKKTQRAWTWAGIGLTCVSILLVIVMIVSIIGQGADWRAGGTIYEETPSVPVTVQTPTSDEELVAGVIFQGALADMSLRFVEATVYAEEILKTAPTLEDREQRIALLDQAIEKWETARTATEQFSAVVNFLSDYEAPISYQEEPHYLLVKRAYAASLDEEIKRIEGELDVSEKEKELGREEILEIVDKAPLGQQLKVAAELFGTDARTAFEVLTEMRDLEGKIALSQVQKFNNYSNAAQVLKTGTKVLVFVGSLAPAAGGAAIALAGKAGVELAAAGANIVTTSISGAGLVMETSGTAVSVGMADENGKIAAIAKAKDAQSFKEMSFIVGILDSVKAIAQVQKIKDAAGGLKNLLTQDGLKKIAGNTQLMQDMKADVAGNLQTIVDSGPAAWDFLTKNPEVNTVLLDLKKLGTLTFVGDNQAVTIKDLPTEKEISDFVEAIYEKAASVSVVSQETPANGAIHIVSTPPGADIWLDNSKESLQTPNTLHEITPGDHKVVLKIPGGYQDYARTVSVIAGQTAQISAKLEPLPAATGNLRIASDQSDATIVIDGTTQDVRTPASFKNVPVGSYKITVKKAGFQDYSERVDVEPMQERQVWAPLKPLQLAKGTLNIGSVPAGADIYIDGQKQGSQTPANYIVEPRTYRVVLKKAGYKDFSATATVAEGRITEMLAKLEAIETKPAQSYDGFYDDLGGTPEDSGLYVSGGDVYRSMDDPDGYKCEWIGKVDSDGNISGTMKQLWHGTTKWETYTFHGKIEYDVMVIWGEHFGKYCLDKQK